MVKREERREKARKGKGKKEMVRVCILVGYNTIIIRT